MCGSPLQRGCEGVNHLQFYEETLQKSIGCKAFLQGEWYRSSDPSLRKERCRSDLAVDTECLSQQHLRATPEDLHPDREQNKGDNSQYSVNCLPRYLACQRRSIAVGEIDHAAQHHHRQKKSKLAEDAVDGGWLFRVRRQRQGHYDRPWPRSQWKGKRIKHF